MILGLDTGTRTLTEAEHLLHDLVKALGLGEDTVACTHFVRTGDGPPHVACSLTVPHLPGPAALPDGAGTASGAGRTGPEDLAEGAALAAIAHATGTGGRLVLFPGHGALTGTLGVAEIMARSGIERVVVLAHTGDPAPDTPVVTRDFVRPQWCDGKIVLLTMPAADGRLMPAEVPDPTPCCADHG
ncbi:hypothetical protein GCM10009677_53270 [Sphaerisporangium rubeum]|uniref:Uncharacterized protein n=1 Tax=Sphaerisporangium rubeum TaxID=321317 RepID=A0A7X0IIK1_9ACTN|nr:hypothetical protein [Sphaerisporangium rubeum]MBB6475568.1 hypothetical protein [Sphaerisporangium rubeum]